jgi:hypothetical protein
MMTEIERAFNAGLLLRLRIQRDELGDLLRTTEGGLLDHPIRYDILKRWESVIEQIHQHERLNASAVRIPAGRPDGS